MFRKKPTQPPLSFILKYRKTFYFSGCDSRRTAVPDHEDVVSAYAAPSRAHRKKINSHVQNQPHRAESKNITFPSTTHTLHRLNHPPQNCSP